MSRSDRGDRRRQRVAERSEVGGVVTIQTADCKWQTTDIGSSETADPYNVILSVSEESQIMHYKLRI